MVASKAALALEAKTPPPEAGWWTPKGRYPNRGRALQAVLDKVLRPHKKKRLAKTPKLHFSQQDALPKEGLETEAWHKYPG